MTQRVVDADIVVVGGGIAGAAVAARMAAAGRNIVVLEREPHFVDRVRGEGMWGWGAVEAEELGLLDTVMATPFAMAAKRGIPYDETLSADEAEAQALDLVRVLRGSPGLIGVGHADLCEALLTEAERRGAHVQRNVEDVSVLPGDHPAVSCRVSRRELQVTGRLVVGADGRESRVRRCAGIDLHVTTPRVFVAGMLVHDEGTWPRDVTTTGIEDDTQFFVMPRGGGLVRLYVGYDARHPHRFSGPDRAKRFLEAFRLRCVPGAEALASATPAGPCAAFPMTDSWVDSPLAPGVALIGDAAGWSDPVIGQGLSVAFRDARVLADLLLQNDDWNIDTLSPYAQERTERMQRLRFANSFMALIYAFGAENRNRRERIRRRLEDQPDLGVARLAMYRGPWRVPAEAFEPGILATLAVL